MVNATLSRGLWSFRCGLVLFPKATGIDAAVIAATDRSLIKRISDMAKRDEKAGAEEFARSVPPP